MSDTKEMFTKEYRASEETTSDIIKEVNESISEDLPDAQDTYMQIEAMLYGINKPRRIVLRAEIIHDKNQERSP